MGNEHNRDLWRNFGLNYTVTVNYQDGATRGRCNGRRIDLRSEICRTWVNSLSHTALDGREDRQNIGALRRPRRDILAINFGLSEWFFRGSRSGERVLPSRLLGPGIDPSTPPSLASPQSVSGVSRIWDMMQVRMYTAHGLIESTRIHTNRVDTTSNIIWLRLTLKAAVQNAAERT